MNDLKQQISKLSKSDFKHYLSCFVQAYVEDKKLLISELKLIDAVEILLELAGSLVCLKIVGDKGKEASLIDVIENKNESILKEVKEFLHSYVDDISAKRKITDVIPYDKIKKVQIENPDNIYDFKR